MPSLTLADTGARATMSDAKPKGKKWVKSADKAPSAKTDEKPAFAPRGSAARRAALYDNKREK